jgi:hypothetical protein
MRKSTVLILVSIGVLGAVALFALLRPRVEDVGSAASMREFTLAGKRYLLIDAPRTDAMSQMSVVRVFQSYDGPESICIDRVSAPVLPVSGSVVSGFPTVIDLSHFGPGAYQVKARIDGQYNAIGTVTVQ